MIEVKNLSKVFRTEEIETTALNNVSFSIEKGEFVAIMGPSGCGKSTLLNVLGLLDNPSGGSYQLLGNEVGGLRESERTNYRKGNIGFVFQFHQLLPEFTALENIIIPALIAGRKRAEAETEAMQLLQVMGLEERAHHKPAEMSGGENQRVAVARALINHPDVVLADEPSGSLDSKNKEELHKLFFDLRDRYGQTFIIVTHDETLASYTDRTLHMVDGVIQDIVVK